MIFTNQSMVRAYADEISQLLNTELGFTTTTPDEIVERVSSDHEKYFIAASLDGSGIRGVCTAYVLPPDDPDAPGGYVENLAVRPDSRKQGVGTELIQRCVLWLRGQGANRFYADAWEHGDFHSRSRGLLEGLGFEATELQEDFFAGSPCPFCGPSCSCPALRMVKYE